MMNILSYIFKFTLSSIVATILIIYLLSLIFKIWYLVIEYFDFIRVKFDDEDKYKEKSIEAYKKLKDLVYGGLVVLSTTLPDRLIIRRLLKNSTRINVKDLKEIVGNFEEESLLRIKYMLKADLNNKNKKMSEISKNFYTFISGGVLTAGGFLFGRNSIKGLLNSNIDTVIGNLLELFPVSVLVSSFIILSILFLVIIYSFNYLYNEIRLIYLDHDFLINMIDDEIKLREKSTSK